MIIYCQSEIVPNVVWQSWRSVCTLTALVKTSSCVKHFPSDKITYGSVWATVTFTFSQTRFSFIKHYPRDLAHSAIACAHGLHRNIYLFTKGSGFTSVVLLLLPNVSLISTQSRRKLVPSQHFFIFCIVEFYFQNFNCAVPESHVLSPLFRFYV